MSKEPTKSTSLLDVMADTVSTAGAESLSRLVELDETGREELAHVITDNLQRQMPFLRRHGFVLAAGLLTGAVGGVIGGAALHSSNSRRSERSDPSSDELVSAVTKALLSSLETA